MSNTNLVLKKHTVLRWIKETKNQPIGLISIYIRPANVPLSPWLGL